jgi:hypothetical protein
MEIGTGDCFAKSYTVDVQDYQNLKDIEDRATDVLLCLDYTLDNVIAIRDMYCCINPHPDVSPSQSSQDEDPILFLLEEKEKEVAYSRKKVEVLLSKAQNTRALVCCPLSFHNARLPNTARFRLSWSA